MVSIGATRIKMNVVDARVGLVQKMLAILRQRDVGRNNILDEICFV